MKAKEYYGRICGNVQKNGDNSDIMKTIWADMVTEMKELIKIRHITEDHATFMVVKEANGKWKAIVRLYQKDNGPPKPVVENSDEVILSKDLGDEDFLYYIYQNVPEFKRFVNVQQVDENGKIIEEPKEERKPINFHVVKPLKEITADNITSEIMACLLALGSYSEAGMKLEWIKPLAYRITLLRYWKETGIKYEQIAEFEKDNAKFVFEVIKPVFT